LAGLNAAYDVPQGVSTAEKVGVRQLSW